MHERLTHNSAAESHTGWHNSNTNSSLLQRSSKELKQKKKTMMSSDDVKPEKAADDGTLEVGGGYHVGEVTDTDDNVESGEMLDNQVEIQVRGGRLIHSLSLRCSLDLGSLLFPVLTNLRHCVRDMRHSA